MNISHAGDWDENFYWSVLRRSTTSLADVIALFADPLHTSTTPLFSSRICRTLADPQYDLAALHFDACSIELTPLRSIVCHVMIHRCDQPCVLRSWSGTPAAKHGLHRFDVRVDHLSPRHLCQWSCRLNMNWLLICPKMPLPSLHHCIGFCWLAYIALLSCAVQSVFWIYRYRLPAISL